MAASSDSEPIRQRRDAVERARQHAPFLARLAERFPDDVEHFIAGGRAAALADAPFVDGDDDIMPAIRRWRGRHALLLALADLAGEDDVATTTRLLTDFADAACDAALAAAFAERVPGEPVRGLAIIALGKMGSHELNYSSDIDPILLFDPATLPCRSRDDPGEAAVRIARRMVEILSARTADGHVLRVDLRLRPHPEVTPIVLPVGAAISYYESEAVAWEQAAFIRSRAAAGDRALGAFFLDAIQPFVWRRSLDFRQLKEIGAMSDRIRDHFAQGQRLGPGFDLKRGRGGIREIEFFAQAHQLIYGGRDPALRLPATVDALAALGRAGRIDAGLAERLSDHYAVLRRIEHRLQMVEDQQTHSLPMQPGALDRVARLDGLADGKALLDLLDPLTDSVGAAYDALVHDHVAVAGWPAAGPDLDAAIAAAGFADAELVAARIGEWRSGRLRALRSPAALDALERVLPQIMGALGQAPDPEQTLLRFDALVAGLPSAINFFHLLAAQPALAQVLTQVLALAPTLAEALSTRSALIEGLIDARAFEAPANVAELQAEWLPVLRDCDYERLLDRVRDRVAERRFAYGVQLIAGTRDPLEVARGYAALAEAALVTLADATVAEFARAHGRIADSELVVLALGRFGGAALTHASDLDLIYLFTGDHLAESDGPRSLGATTYYNRLAQRLTAALSVPTASGKLYEVDTRLRPQGAQGPLVVSLDSFARYQREDAWLWEHMALLRTRPVYGSARARAAVEAIIADTLAMPRDPAVVRRDAADMRDRMAEHKPPQGPLDVKSGRGGLVDLEFALHVRQLETGVGQVPPLDAALAALVAAGLAPDAIIGAEALLSRLLVMLRLTAPGGEEPSAPAAAAVARACGQPDWNALLAAHDAARQQVADWWQSIRPPD